jgi:hypothetical protein
MSKREDMVREIEGALTRAPERSKSGRYAVYVPGAVVIGTYDQRELARDVAAGWSEVVPEVIVVDRGTGAAP